MAEIEYRTKSAQGKVCHPFFKGPAGGLTIPRYTGFDRLGYVSIGVGPWPHRRTPRSVDGYIECFGRLC